MHHSTLSQSLPVVIVGGSLVGLSAALFLAMRDVPVILVEKHTGSAAHPRAMGFTERSLEYFRVAGLGDAIPQVAPDMRLRRVRADSLTGAWHDESAWTPGETVDAAPCSPCTGAAIAQDKLEPILRGAAVARGADIRLGVEMLGFSQDADGVTVRVRPRGAATSYDISASYLVAADGAGSTIRDALGIARTGVGHLKTLRSVLFRCADADAWLAHGIQQFAIEQDGFSAFLTSYGDGRWVAMTDDDDTPWEPSDLVRRVLGRIPGRTLPFDILATGRWELAGRIAERYAAGRVFLAGDAAHQLPPTRGGFGANTGIDDAYNLAWKLAWVLQGDAAPGLLDTYDAERRPIGWLRHQQTFARPDYAAMAGGVCDGVPLFGKEAMELGQLVRSSAVVGAGPGLLPAAHPDDWAGQPGTRAPHLWGRHRGERVSTIDLLTSGFVVLSEDARWIDAARAAARVLDIDIGALHVGRDLVFDDEGAFRERFGVQEGGAVLVRPDGIVAWRSPADVSQPAQALMDVLRQVLSR